MSSIGEALDGAGHIIVVLLGGVLVLLFVAALMPTILQSLAAIGSIGLFLAVMGAIIALVRKAFEA